MGNRFAPKRLFQIGIEESLALFFSCIMHDLSAHTAWLLLSFSSAFIQLRMKPRRDKGKVFWAKESDQKINFTKVIIKLSQSGQWTMLEIFSFLNKHLSHKQNSFYNLEESYWCNFLWLEDKILFSSGPLRISPLLTHFKQVWLGFL